MTPAKFLIMIKEVLDIYDPALKMYSSLTEAQLSKAGNGETGFFIAESPKVIQVAIEHGYEPESLLCERKHITGDAASIIAAFPNITVYTGEREILSELTGYKLTRGVLCVMKRKPMISVEDICNNSRMICVLHGISDTTNIGSIFRSASALGVDGIILSKDTCDPLNRRSVRVSMGTVFTIPWTWCDKPVAELNNLGFSTLAMALKENSLSMDDPSLKLLEKIALVFGTEGYGLPDEVIHKCHKTVRIPMSHGVDSLNVGASAAVAFWELRKN